MPFHRYYILFLRQPMESFSDQDINFVWLKFRKHFRSSATCDNILNHLLKPITTCQRSSAWLEHLTCNQKVEGPNPFVGFYKILCITDFKKCQGTIPSPFTSL